MKKLEQVKQAIRDTPPERLAKVEYQSHFMQIIGVLAVCIILISKGFWYIIFALIFSVGVSYSQGVNAYRRYKVITEGITYDPKLDKSPSRRRGYFIEQRFGKKAKWISIAKAVVVAVLVTDPNLSRWILMIIYPLQIILYYIISYYFMMYWIAKYFKKKK